MSPETEAEILRLFHAEGWRRNTIAQQLGLHHSTVSRVIRKATIGAKAGPSRASKIDPYIEFINRTLEQYPKLNATRLYHMAKERGYSGGVDHFRAQVRKLRPAPTGEAYLRLRTLPGEQGQVDWASFGRLEVQGVEYRLLAFVMVLSWSRRIFLRFYLGDDTACFLRGHVEAFEHYQAVPRELLYDNLKTAVIERVDSAIRFNPELLRLSAHYRFAPKPVPVARPTSKGKVERAIQYARSSFFAARSFHGLSDLNQQALDWCVAEAQKRRCPNDKTVTVAEAFEEEKPAMLALPSAPYPVFERKAVQVGKTPYVRFAGNDYSVPHHYVRRSLLVQSTEDVVQVVDGLSVVAEHPRSYGKNQVIEDARHIESLEKVKKAAHRHGGMHRILSAIPSSKTFFKKAAERGHNMGRLTQLLLQMMDLYGSPELEFVMGECITSGRIHSQAIRDLLEARRQAKGLPQPVPLTFLNGRHVDEVTPKSLDAYDRLFNMEEEQ